MRIMFDTNVLISMYLFPNKRINQLKKSIEEEHQLFLCSYVIDELRDVIDRKFQNKHKEIDTFLQALPFTMCYTPEIFDKNNFPRMRDDFDVPILVTAILEDMDILVTGDKDFLDLDIEKPIILSPSEFLKL